jgi:group I intron endonuclease
MVTSTKESYMYLYLMTNTVNGKQYVGITTRTLEVRFHEHCFVALRGRKTLIAAAIRKYGSDAFRIELLAEALDYTTLQQMERAAIAQQGTFRPHGYNLTLGGEGTLGRLLSEEARLRIALANKGRVRSDAHKAAVSRAQRGRVVSEETREKMGAWQHGEHNNMYGKHVSEEHKQHLREVHTGKQYALGRTHSAEAREKMSRAHTGQTHTPEAREKIAAAKRGKPRSDETKAKISAATKAYLAEHGNPMQGRTHSAETRAKLAAKASHPAWNKGQKTGPLSEDTRAKLSAAHQGQSAWNKGIPHTEDAKAKMSASRTGGNNWKARAIELDGTVYPSIMDAVRATGLSRMQVTYRLQKGEAQYVTTMAKE